MTVLTSMVLLVATASFGALLINSERLRAAASTDAGLTTQLEGRYSDVADALSESAARSAMLAAARTNHPPVTLTEVLAIVGAVASGPVYVASFDTGPRWLVTASHAVVLIALLCLYSLATSRWCRRAVARIEAYAKVGVTSAYDAAEATRQLWLTMFVQAFLICTSTTLSLLIGMARVTHRDWAFGAMMTGIALGLAATYLPLRTMRREESTQARRAPRTLKSPIARGSAWQLLDQVRHPHLYASAMGDPPVREGGGLKWSVGRDAVDRFESDGGNDRGPST